jgi:trans-aconitate methyltransferase
MPHEFDGVRYAAASAHQKEWGSRLIDELALRGDERVLDIGCGDGALTAAIAALVPRGRVLGIDASRGMIDVARGRAGGNLSFRLMDAADISLRGEFEIVFSNACLHWVLDHTSVLAATFAALAPGGVARFNFGGEGNCIHLIRVVREVMASREFARWFDGFAWPWYMPGVVEYDKAAAALPWSERHVWLENADRNFPNADALVGWIDQPSIVPFLAAVGDADKQRFRDAVVGRMLEATHRPDGTYFETFRRINLLARK